MIDLRSDTVTKPSDEMRAAMAAAGVGDDVFGDDPTVNELEKRTAEILGKEAAVYMPSGTMTNQVAIRCHTEPGDEILIEAEAHLYFYEGGAPAALSGVMVRLIRGNRGIFTGEQLTGEIRPENVHHPKPKLVCIENTSNRGGGSIWPIETIAEVAGVAKAHGLRMHLDGARLWNASVATGIPESRYAEHFDSVSVCFSKSLGAPVGSALAGSRQFAARARRFRKQFGGGMRQAGIIAAGALYALEHNRDRLAADHANAKLLVEGINGIPGVSADPAGVETNLVYFDVDRPADQVAQSLAAKGVLVLALGKNRIRAVPNLMVTSGDISKAVEAIEAVMTNG